MVATRVVHILRETYPLAQQAFLEFEVFEQGKSRKTIRHFVAALDLLSRAVAENSEAHADDAENILRDVTTQTLSFLCDSRLNELLRLPRRGWVFWSLLFMRNPFKRVHVDNELQEAVASYERGLDPGTGFPERAQSLQGCFEHLEKVLTFVQPHRVYDHIFAWIVTIFFGIVAFLLGLVFF